MPTQNNNSKIARLPVFAEEKELQKFLETNFTESLKQLIKVTVKTMVKAEMEELRKGFADKPYFNGYYDRNMVSSFGKIDDIPVPRFRSIQEPMELKTMEVFTQEQAKFAQLVEQMHLLGISQRKIRQLAWLCFKVKMSPTKVGKIYRELAEKEEANLNHQPLDDNYEYLLMDGIWEKTKGYGWDDNQSVLLCVLAIRPNGERKVLGFTLARSENTDSWSQLLKGIKQRGLTGKNLKLVITDDNQSAKNSLAIFYPGVAVQNCIVHKMRNVLAKTTYKNKRQMADDLKSIFGSQDRKEAETKAKQTVRKWYLIEPKATESLRYNIEYCFTYFNYPKAIWSKIRTTNILEREFREVRRRIKVFDNTFQNETSANNYTNTIFNYLNENYPFERRITH